MRRTLLPALILTTALVLSACGDDSNPDGDSNMDGGNDMGSDQGGGMDGTDHGGQANTPMADGAREIEMHAASFAFDPGEMTIEAGEDVAIVLTAEDMLHDFTVEDADGHVSAEAGETASGGLRIDEPGTYTFYCSVEGHREAGMEGTLVVE